MDIINELNIIFRDVLKRENLTLQRSYSAKDVEGWDSLSNMILISKIEKRFNIRFKFRDIIKMKNVGDLCDYIMLSIKND